MQIAVWATAHHGTVFRGADLNWEQTKKYIDAFENKKTIIEEAFTSTSMEQDKAFERNTAFEIISKNGKVIENISYFSHEKEVLFKSETKFNIKNIENMGDGTTKITLEEL